MKFPYDPFIIRRLAEGRIFFVNPKMPFEFFLDCFQYEHPFFLVSHLDDGRIAIIPNMMVIPKAWLQAGFNPKFLLPANFEYVTTKKGTYPMIITAHPVAKLNDWLLNFERLVFPFAKQTLTEFVNYTFETTPLNFERTPVEEPVTI